MKIVEAWHGPGRRDGEITPVGPEGNAAHLDDHKLAFEHWYFDARLDDGHIVVGFIQTRELIQRKPGVELHVYRPDGTRLGYLAPEAGRLNVWVADLATAASPGEGDAVCVTHDHVRGIASWPWSRDARRILYVQDQGGDEDFHLHVAELDRPGDPSRDLAALKAIDAVVAGGRLYDSERLAGMLREAAAAGKKQPAPTPGAP